MCARRFLVVIFLLTLLIVAGAFALYQFGPSVIVKQALPSGSFEAPPPASGPDYVQTDNWLNLPDSVPPGPASWRPSGTAPQDAPSRSSATFYIHPTTYLQKDRWNALLGDRESQDRAALFTRTQASAFGFTRVYAPRYRQAAYGAFLDRGFNAVAALDLAYGDIASAFDRFLMEEPDRPIILAGHSQGALHLTRLLRERVARDPKLARRIVAAYVVGWPVSKTADVPLMGLPACETRGQSGCILSWLSFKQPANTQLITDVYESTSGFTGARRTQSDILCVNPLTGTQGDAAPPSANAGTLVPTDTTLRDATAERGQVGAACENGFLMLSFLDDRPPELGPYVIPGNIYHVYDYALFWADIRRDAAERLAAWRQ